MDFQRQNDGGPVYVGECLLDKNKKNLSWFTHWRPGSPKHERQERMIEDFLDHGITGAPMRYTRRPSRNQIDKYKNQIMFGDTIQGRREYKYGPARIFAKSLLDAHRQTKYSLEMFWGMYYEVRNWIPHLKRTMSQLCMEIITVARCFCGSDALCHLRIIPMSLALFRSVF